MTPRVISKQGEARGKPQSKGSNSVTEWPGRIVIGKYSERFVFAGEHPEWERGYFDGTATYIPADSLAPLVERLREIQHRQILAGNPAASVIAAKELQREAGEIADRIAKLCVGREHG